MKKNLEMIAIILLVIGGLNWGLVGLFNFDLVGGIFGYMSLFSRGVFTVVGIAAVYYVISRMSGE